MSAIFSGPKARRRGGRRQAPAPWRPAAVNVRHCPPAKKVDDQEISNPELRLIGQHAEQHAGEHRPAAAKRHQRCAEQSRGEGKPFWPWPR